MVGRSQMRSFPGQGGVERGGQRCAQTLSLARCWNRLREFHETALRRASAPPARCGKSSILAGGVCRGGGLISAGVVVAAALPVASSLYSATPLSGWLRIKAALRVAMLARQQVFALGSHP
jgi:hypothetical protein